MPSGDDDEIAARLEPLPCFGEGLAGERRFGEPFFAARLLDDAFFGVVLFGDFLAGRTLLECRTFIRFWSTVVACRRAALRSIRPCAAMHRGFAVRTHASHQVARGAKVAGGPCEIRRLRLDPGQAVNP
jgi:hypothetical protein